MPLLDLPQLVVRGTPQQLGAAQGAAFARQIRDFVPMRFGATHEYLATLGHASIGPLLDVGKQCMALYARWHPEGFAEHLAIAQAAGVDATELYTAANMTDLRDVLALGAREVQQIPADAEGCSAILLPAAFTASGEAIGAQTWDLNPQDLDYVVAIRRIPEQGPQTWSVTCTGCLSLVGLNDAGLAVGTTNIKTRGSKPGIGYMGILHRMLASRSFEEAAGVCVNAPRAAAHTYWLASQDRLSEWETTAWSAVRRDAVREPLARTNHCLVPEHSEREGESPSSSSRARLDRLRDRLSRPDQDVGSLRDLFADRTSGIDSINRYAEDGQGTSTNSCVIAIPARRELYACRGSADRGAWVRLDFSEVA
jgi:isopenicillin-N N-acyltransferase-like protein